jgi:streptogramin lyase
MKQSNLKLAGSAKTLAVSLLLASLGMQTLLAGGRSTTTDIVFTDSQAAVLRANTATRGTQVVAAGDKLSQPFGICVSATGECLVTDTGCMALIGIDPANGTQRLVSAGGLMGVPFGIAPEASGSVLVANAASLIRVDPATGAQTTASSGGFFQAPVAVAVAGNGNVFVADLLGAVIQVNPRTGAQTLITSGGYLNRPQGIAVNGQHIYVTDVASADGNFGTGRIIHINAKTGEQTVLSEGAYLAGPVGISVLDSGSLVVADPYTMNDAGSFDGAIVLVDAVTGNQTFLAGGADGFVNPRCVSIFPR